jgi:FKBP-type peptidyl-prolyl cis-trans isomerase SlyD
MSGDLAVARDRVVRFHYEMRDEAGTVLESSRAEEPLAVLHGRGNLMPGIEAALEGHGAGDRFQVSLEPGEAYGERKEGLTQRVSKKYFPQAARLKPGMTVQLSTREGPRPVTVLKVGGKVVDVDLNHPLAGRALTFDIEVVEVREASPEEIAHRHVHGPGGHHH